MYKAPPSQPPNRSNWFFRPPNRWLALAYVFPTLVWLWRMNAEPKLKFKVLMGIMALIFAMLALADALPARRERLAGWLRIGSLLSSAGILAWIVITNL